MTDGATVEGTRLPTAVASSIKCKGKALMEEGVTEQQKNVKTDLELTMQEVRIAVKMYDSVPVLSYIDLHLDCSRKCFVLPLQISKLINQILSSKEFSNSFSCVLCTRVRLLSWVFASVLRHFVCSNVVLPCTTCFCFSACTFSTACVMLCVMWPELAGIHVVLSALYLCLVLHVCAFFSPPGVC